jgi:AraC family transcriptional regulator of adaptative response / DNA-3-methyladenine glycosylase II
VVSRALRLIEAGAMDHGKVDELAEHVGIGARHLRRLFAEHLGTAPIQIANSRRLRLARQLLNETSLRVNQIASASGFQSVRQFNHAMRSSFDESPSGLRRDDRTKPDPGVILDIPLRSPLDWDAMLRFFRKHTIPGIDAVDDRGYRRTIQIGDATGFIEVASNPNQPRLSVKVSLSRVDALVEVADRVRALFELGANPSYPSAFPGAWDPFELAVLAILGERFSRPAGSPAIRLINTFGAPINTSIPGLTHLFPGPKALAEAELAGIGITRPQVEAIGALATALRDDHCASKSSTNLLSRLAGIIGASEQGETALRYIALRFGDRPYVRRLATQPER